MPDKKENPVDQAISKIADEVLSDVLKSIHWGAGMGYISIGELVSLRDKWVRS